MNDIISSPCINICTLKEGLCIGCGRNLQEIGEWASASDNRKQEILALLPARMDMVADDG